MIDGYKAVSIVNRLPDFIYDCKRYVDCFSKTQISKEVISRNYEIRYHENPPSVCIDDARYGWSICVDEYRIELFYSKKLKNKPRLPELLEGIIEEVGICKYFG